LAGNVTDVPNRETAMSSLIMMSQTPYSSRALVLEARAARTGGLGAFLKAAWARRRVRRGEEWPLIPKPYFGAKKKALQGAPFASSE
jgi:hypothetical protein